MIRITIAFELQALTLWLKLSRYCLWRMSMTAYRSIIRILLIFCALLLTSATSWADDYDDAKICGQGKGVASFQSCSRLAQKGDKAAQFNLGLFYDRGEGTAIDKAKAIFWVRKAAEQGLLEAELGLGQRLMTDEWGAKDMAQASKWLRLAADKNNAEAQYWLGQLYRLGEGVEEDRPQSISWYRKSAEQGNAFAQYWTGVLLTTKKSASLPVSAKEAEEGVKWLKLAAEQNMVPANVKIGIQYSQGEGVPQDFATAYSYYLKAAQAGDSLGIYLVGVSLYRGQGVGKNRTKAFEWLNKSITLDLPEENKSDAFFAIAQMYLIGDGVERNHQNALNMLRKAASSGHLESRKYIEYLDNQAKYSTIDPRTLVDMSKSDERYLDAVGSINKKGSGFLISKCHVLTARHAVFDNPSRFESKLRFLARLEIEKEVTFDVGQLGVPPYKKFESTGVVVDFPKFTTLKHKAHPIYDLSDYYDWALIKLNKLSDGTYPGNKIKPFCFYSSASELIPSEKYDGLSVRVVGHPSEKTFQTGNTLLWQDKNCKLVGGSGETTCTARLGMSGGPVVLNQQGEFNGCWQPMGILVRQGDSKDGKLNNHAGFTIEGKYSSNHFSTIDLPKYERIKKAMDENPCN